MLNDPLTILNGDALTMLCTLPDESVQCCVTSPPYWGLRDYGVKGQIGLENTPEAYVDAIVGVFRDVRRVLRKDGTLWLNLGDSYAGSMKGANGDGTWQDRSNCKQGTNTGSLGIPPVRASKIGLKNKDLVGIPWMVAFALRADGWYLRSDIIWSKPNPMPESVTDRPTKSHEYIFLLTKSERYFYDADSIRERAITSPDDGSHQAFGTSGGKVDATPGKTRRESGQKWQRKTLQDFGQSPHTKNMNREMGISDPDYLVRNKRTVWEVATKPYPDAHFATYPPELITPCILAGSKCGDTVLDPFAGSFTTCKVAIELGRKAIGIELNPDYIKLGQRRCRTTIGFNFGRT